MELQKLRIKLSADGYNEKPTTEDIKKITYTFKQDYSSQVLSYENLSKVLKGGHSVLLADYKDNCSSLSLENINSISCIALDIDSKEKPISMYEMISVIYNKIGAFPIINYCTFSDSNMTKFRLIYRFESKIDVETYKVFYKAMQWKFKQLDQQTSNPNRIWAGTNKMVEYRDNDKPITIGIIVKLVNSYNSMIARKDKKSKIEFKSSFQDIKGNSFIKKEYKEQVSNYLIENINLKDYIEKHFGGKFKRNGDNFTGCCSLHGGDNPSSLVISNRIYTCFTRCGTGNIFTLAKKVYNNNDFSLLAFKLAEEYNLYIPKEYIVEVQ